MMPPKQVFQKGPHKSTFENMVESVVFREAIFYALLQMEFLSPESMDEVMSAGYYQRLAGAKQFIRILEQLCDAEEPSPASKTPTLNYKV